MLRLTRNFHFGLRRLFGRLLWRTGPPPTGSKIRVSEGKALNAAALGPGTPQPWPPEWGRWFIKAERTAYPKLLKQAHELSPLSWRETAQRRSIIRSTGTLRIRHGHGLDGSTVASISPLRATTMITLTDFHLVSRASRP